MRVLILLCVSALAWGQQSLVLNTTNGSLSGTTPSTGIWSGANLRNTDQRWEWRFTDITPPSSGYPRALAAINTDATVGHMLLLSLTTSFDSGAGNDLAGNPISSICANFIALDSGPQGPFKCLSVVGRTDITVRVTRDVTNLLRRLEMWDTATGTNYAVSPSNWTIDTVGTPLAGLPISLGGTPRFSDTAWTSGTPTARVAWFKWHNTALPAGSAMPKAGDAAALGNWLLEGNGTDVNGNITLSNVGTPGYLGTPALNPISNPRTLGYQSITTPSWTPWIAMRAGVQGQMDGSSSSSDEVGALTYQWAQVSGPSTLTWSSRTTSQPLINGLVFGTYVVSLKATAPSGLAATSTLQFGSVAMDDNGVVVNSDAEIDKIIGPQVAFGRSIYTYLDNSAYRLANFYGALLATDYADVWSTPVPSATIQGVAGSTTTTVTGTGTNWVSDGTCAANNYLVWHINDASNYNGNSTQYMSWDIQSCTNNGQLILGYPLTIPAGSSFTIMSSTAYGRWVGQGSNANYYDNVLAHYAFYYRSGNSLYLNYARTLADRWISGPWLNYFRSGGSAALNGAPRLRAMTGLVLRARDGKSTWWPALHTPMDLDNTLFNDPISTSLTTRDYDAREDWMRMSGLALGSAYSTDGTKRSTYAATLASAITNWWTPIRGANGEWTMAYETGFAGATRLAVTNGSTTATFSGGATGTVNTSGTGVTWISGTKFDNLTAGMQIKINNVVYTIATPGGSEVLTLTGSAGTQTGVSYEWGFQPVHCSGIKRVWLTTTNHRVGQDSRDYTCTYVNFNTITLSAAYADSPGTKKFSVSNTTGLFSQPFMMGIAMSSMWHVYQYTANSTIPTWMTDTANWLINSAYRSQSGGIFYIRTSLTCEPTANANANTWCIDEGVGIPDTQREYAIEILSQSYGFARLVTGNTAFTTQGDIHAANLFGAPGFTGPGVAGLSGANLTDISISGKFAKYHGFYSGLGRMAVYPAARLGGVAAADPVTIGFALGTASGESAAPQIIYTSPTGTATTVTCSAASVGWYCPGAGNRRDGQVIFHQVIRTFTGGQSRGETSPLRVQ